MNPNDFMGYPQGQQPQQPMQMPNFNPAMQMQPNFGKGIPNFNPASMQMNRPNNMNQFQAMQFQGMPNPMGQMPPGPMPNQIPPSMGQNMMKQHNMMPPAAPSFGFPAPNSRHRSSLTGMQNQYSNHQPMFPQMIPPQSGTQPPTGIPSQPTQTKKKRSSSTAPPSGTMVNNTNVNANTPTIAPVAANNTANSTNSMPNPLAPSSSIDNIANSSNQNPNIATPSSTSIPEIPQEKPPAPSSRSGSTKSGSSSTSQKHSMIPNQPNIPNLGQMGNLGGMNNLTPMNSMNNMNMSMNNMNNMNNMNMGGMNMNNMNPMNMNMNMGMNMGMPMGGMPNMNMNQMNVMGGMNMMNQMNPMNSGINLSQMPSMNNINTMGSMSGNLSSMGSMSGMGGMSGMGSMPSMSSMGSMPGISPSASNPNQPQNIPPSQQPQPSSQPQQGQQPSQQSQTQQQTQPNQPIQQPNQPNQQPTQPTQSQTQHNPQQQPIIPTIQVPSQIQATMNANLQMGMVCGVGLGAVPPEISRMRLLLNSIYKDKADLFFSLFDIHQGKEREDKVEFFIQNVMNSFHPSWIAITLSFLEQIQQAPTTSYSNQSANPLSIAVPNNSNNNSGTAGPQVAVNINPYYKFKEPLLPMVFSKVKGCKPSFKNLSLNKNRLEFAPNKNCRKYIVLGSFICANETIDPAQYSLTVTCDKNEVHPLKFGENENFYLFFQEGKAPSRFAVQVTCQSGNFPPSFLTWFVCQYVEKRKADDILSSLLTAAMPSTTQNEKVQLARTPMCKGCSFYAIRAIEDILNKGYAICPYCEANINLNDLIFDNKAAAPPQQIRIEEDKEMHQGRMACADALTSLMKPSHTEQNWKIITFEEGPLKPAKYDQPNYTNISEFRNELSQYK